VTRFKKPSIKFLKPTNKRISLFGAVFIVVLLIVGATGVVINNSYRHRDIKVKEFTFKLDVKKKEIKETKKPIVTAPAPASIWPVELNLSQASSITVVVNKKHKLPAGYVPPDLTPNRGGYLRAEVSGALDSLFAAALNAGIQLTSVSDYRSYQTQAAVYNNYVARDGQTLADTYSARPGYSEHQTGLAVDIGAVGTGSSLNACFGDTAAGQWIAANAPAYGFIIRYPAGKEAITGYQYEPWHLRYLGVGVAQAVTTSGKTLDEYFGKPAGGY
jgi:D-alanyl-D-alanine carboxypeptidase